MPEKDSIVELMAKAMFDKNHHYHSELTWENANPSHREFYLKQARAAYQDAIEPALKRLAEM